MKVVDVQHATKKLDLRNVSIKELVNNYVELQNLRRHREILVWAMSEVKVSVDHWGEETEALECGNMILHDVDRLREIVAWCLKEIDKMR